MRGVAGVPGAGVSSWTAKGWREGGPGAPKEHTRSGQKAPSPERDPLN